VTERSFCGRDATTALRRGRGGARPQQKQDRNIIVYYDIGEVMGMDVYRDKKKNEKAVSGRRRQCEKRTANVPTGRPPHLHILHSRGKGL